VTEYLSCETLRADHEARKEDPEACEGGSSVLDSRSLASFPRVVSKLGGFGWPLRGWRFAGPFSLCDTLPASGPCA